MAVVFCSYCLKHDARNGQTRAVAFVIIAVDSRTKGFLGLARNGKMEDERVMRMGRLARRILQRAAAEVVAANTETVQPAAKITQIREFTPAAWAKARSTEKVVAQAA